jgi:hypothetical protein
MAEPTLIAAVPPCGHCGRTPYHAADCPHAGEPWPPIKEEARTKLLHKGAKDSMDELGKRLSRLISEFNGRERDGQLPLATIPDSPETIAGRNAALHKLSSALLGKQCFLEVEELAKLTDEQRGSLQFWAASKKKGPILPEVLATAHVAGYIEPDDSQRCAKCGLQFPRGEGGFHMVDSLIGPLDCAGANLEESRPISKRGSKKTKKVDHDAVRSEQAAGQDEATR